MNPPESSPVADGRPVVLVTGASSGIGRACAIEFAVRRDAHLVLAARRLDELQRTKELALERAGSDRSVTLVACDLATQDGVDDLCASVRSLGRLDVLVNNAGVGAEGRFDSPDALAAADLMLSLNLRTPIVLSHALFDLLAEARGSIVNVSSVAGLVGTPDAEVYSATKWGLTGFSEALRASATRRGVHVACVQPGPVPTPGWPHARLSSRPVSRALLTSDVTTIARSCVRASLREGSPAPVRPRAYAAIPLLRALAPWLLRRLLMVAVRRDVRASLHATTRDTAGR